MITMPRGDRTGPQGMGPMTGRQAGYCAGFSAPGYMNPVGTGRGMGFRRGGGRGAGGYGRGRGMGWGWNAPAYGYPQAYPAGSASMSKEDELNVLRQEAKALEQETQSIQSRIIELEKNE